MHKDTEKNLRLDLNAPEFYGLILKFGRNIDVRIKEKLFEQMKDELVKIISYDFIDRRILKEELEKERSCTCFRDDTKCESHGYNQALQDLRDKFIKKI